MSMVAAIGPLVMFMLAMTITPGPNNMMLTASGANYGYWRSLPHIGGIMGGCFVLILAVALGLGALFERWPALRLGLQFLGCAYLLLLAWRIGTAPPPRWAAAGQPLSFWQAATFQILNPKAWMMAIAIAAGLLPDLGPLWWNALVAATVGELVALPCISAWTLFGAGIGRLLHTDAAWRHFNRSMGVLTASCAFMMLH